MGKWKNAAETTKREVRVDGLKLGTTYDVRVRAWHGKKLALGKFGRTLFGLGEENTKTTKLSMKGIKGMRKDTAGCLLLCGSRPKPTGMLQKFGGGCFARRKLKKMKFG